MEHQLLKLNVNDHVEKKQGLSYLSWAWAWQEALKIDPTASFTVHTFDKQPYMNVNGTGMVWVSVSLGSRTRTCFLPVMDHRNKPIQNPDAFQVNTAIMRCMTKCLALHGLGLYIYAGEDLPEETVEKVEKVETLESKDIPNKEDLLFFAEKLLENLSMQDTEKALRGYWKANQEKIDELKNKMPELYKDVQAKFAAKKKAILEGAENE